MELKHFYAVFKNGSEIQTQHGYYRVEARDLPRALRTACENIEVPAEGLLLYIYSSSDWAYRRDVLTPNLQIACSGMITEDEDEDKADEKPASENPFGPVSVGLSPVALVNAIIDQVTIDQGSSFYWAARPNDLDAVKAYLESLRDQLESEGNLREQLAVTREDRNAAQLRAVAAERRIKYLEEMLENRDVPSEKQVEEPRADHCFEDADNLLGGIVLWSTVGNVHWCWNHKTWELVSHE